MSDLTVDGEIIRYKGAQLALFNPLLATSYRRGFEDLVTALEYNDDKEVFERTFIEKCEAIAKVQANLLTIVDIRTIFSAIRLDEKKP